MRSETKKITAFLIAIAIVLLFSFTGVDKIGDVPYRRNTEDVLKELRLELSSYTFLLFDLKRENRLLRMLLYEDKGKLYSWLNALYRANKTLARENAELHKRLEGSYWDVFRDLPLRKD